MKTTAKQLNMNKVITKAILFVEAASDNNHRVSAERITELYNAECDEQFDASPEEFSLACTIAIGAITEQEGSNIQGMAAIDNLYSLIDISS